MAKVCALVKGVSVFMASDWFRVACVSRGFYRYSGFSDAESLEMAGFLGASDLARTSSFPRGLQPSADSPPRILVEEIESILQWPRYGATPDRSAPMLLPEVLPRVNRANI